VSGDESPGDMSDVESPGDISDEEMPELEEVIPFGAIGGNGLPGPSLRQRVLALQRFLALHRFLQHQRNIFDVFMNHTFCSSAG